MNVRHEWIRICKYWAFHFINGRLMVVNKHERKAWMNTHLQILSGYRSRSRKNMLTSSWKIVRVTLMWADSHSLIKSGSRWYFLTGVLVADDMVIDSLVDFLVYWMSRCTFGHRSLYNSFLKWLNCGVFLLISSFCFIWMRTGISLTANFQKAYVADSETLWVKWMDNHFIDSCFKKSK